MKLEGLTREEILELKAQLEQERKDIRFQLLTPAKFSPRKLRLMEEAYEIKGKQINHINRFIQQKKRQPKEGGRNGGS